jgi:hypothetical protein
MRARVSDSCELCEGCDKGGLPGWGGGCVVLGAWHADIDVAVPVAVAVDSCIGVGGGRWVTCPAPGNPSIPRSFKRDE